MTDGLQAKIRNQDFLHIWSDSAKHYDKILSQELPFPAYYVSGVSNLQRSMSCEQQCTRNAAGCQAHVDALHLSLSW
jgi:hypothetical protein